MSKKSLGQHFLRDPAVVEQILGAAHAESGRRILEIGPGTGALTGPLLDRGADVVAVEKDDDLAPALARRFHGRPFQVIHGDVLQVDLAPLAREGRTVVGNLPYNVSLAILARLLDADPPFPRMVLMFQQEVAERVVAGPGGRDYGVPSVLAALTSHVELALRVPPSAFAPPPKVQSAVLILRPRDEALLVQGLREPFLAAVSSWFRYRRKTLRNALRAAGPDPLAADRALAAAGIAGTLRPEALSPEDLLRLWSAWRATAGA